MNEALRPRTIAELLDHTVEMYRHHFVLLFGISAVFLAPLLCLSILVTDVMSIVLSLGSLVVSLLVTGAMSYAVACIYLKRPVTIMSAYRVALRYGLDLFVAVVITGLVIGVLLGLLIGAMVAVASVGDMFDSLIGFIAVIGLLVVGILVMVAVGVLFILSPAVVVLEGKSAMAAVRRSYQLVKATWRRVWAAQICVLVMLYALLIVLTAPILAIVTTTFDRTDPTSAMTMGIVSSLVIGLASMVVTPLQMIVTTLLYYDARIRLEGFDIEMLAQQFAEDSPVYAGLPGNA